MGPTFQYLSYYSSDICICNHCNKDNSCSIGNDGTSAFECHPTYKCSLFVNTADPNTINSFSVLDYEVFAVK